MKALLTDIVVVGTVMFLVGTWLSSHHSHKMITDDHPEHKVREFLYFLHLLRYCFNHRW